MKGPFFYRSGDQEIGPLSTPQLKQHAANGQLQPEDRVWTEDTPQGCRARKIKDLFGEDGQEPARAAAFEAPPPPLPPALPVPSSAAHAAPAAMGPVAGPSRSYAGIALGVLRRVFTELFLSFKALFSQIGRTISYLKARRGIQRADREATAALQALGAKIESVGRGESGLRSQLASLRDRRQAMTQANAPTNLLDAEERGLLMRLATPYLDSPDPQPTLEPELARARQLKGFLAAAGQQQQVQQLLPAQWSDRLRVVGGLLLVIVGVWYSPGWLGSGKRAVSSLFHSNRKEVWLAENDTFPRRKRIGYYDGNVVQGEVKLYDDQDRLMGVLNMKDDEYHGLCTFYYPSGAKLYEGEYLNGKRTGMHTTWFADGTVAWELDTADDKPHGADIKYYPNGKKFLEQNWVRGKKEGKAWGYVPDGRRCTEFTYKADEQLSAVDLFKGSEENLRAITERANLVHSVKAAWAAEQQRDTNKDSDGSPDIKTDTDWVRVSMPEGGYSASFPVEPTRTEQDVFERSGGQVKRLIEYWAEKDGIRFSVMVSDMTPEGRRIVRRDGPATNLRAQRDAILSALPGTELVREGEIQIAGFSGVDVISRFPDGAATKTVRQHVYILDDVPCNLVVGSFDAEAVTSPVAEKFFNSFKLDAVSGSNRADSASTSETDDSTPGTSHASGEIRTFDGKRYQVFTDVLAWHDAKRRCQTLKGHLAIVTSKAQNDFITGIVKDAGLAEAWLGATDEKSEGSWIWVDGTPMDYTNWNAGQPNNKGAGEHYLLLWAAQNGKWADQPNISSQHKPGFVLQFDAE